MPGIAIDIGGGQGYWAIKLAQLGWQVTLVEKSQMARRDALYLTKPFSNRIQIYDSLENLKLNSANLLCSLEVLEHLPDPAQTLRDWSGYLKVGGYGLFSFPAWPEWFGADDVRAGHLCRYSCNDVSDLFSSSNGWTLCRVSGYGFPFRNLLQAYNNLRFQNEQFEEPNQATLSSGVYKEARLPFWLDYATTVVTDFFQRLIGPRKPNWGLVVLVQKND
jgi:SAM-dependent methyltransferase